MTEENNTPKGPNKKGLIAIAVAGAVIGVVFLGKNTSGDVEQVDVAAKPIEIGSDPVNTISLKDRDASLTQFAKQFESLEQKLALQEQNATKRETQMRQELQRNEHTLKAQVAALKDELISLRVNGVENAYSSVNSMDGRSLQVPGALPENLPPLPSGGLDFEGFNLSDMPPLQPSPAQAPASPYGPNYFILKPQTATATATSHHGGNSLNASEEQLFASMGQPAPQNTSYNDPNAGQGAQQPPAKQYASAAEAYEDQQKIVQQAAQQAPTGPKLERITIPAFSFVEVTTLHGVACPVGANAPGQKSEIPARPVVLPVRGIFRGPNGSTVDVGNIHLMGLCSGRRTASSKTGRATVRVEQMSYWDETGDSQMVASTGYIVDTRDNEQDVYGRLDKASGRTLALESAAAAAAAFATSMSQAEYTTQNNMNSNGSTSTSQLTGDAGKAAISQGVAALFTKIANRFEQEANAAIDTVIVEPGIRLRFVTDQPISIYKPAEAFDIDAGMRDVLL